MSSHAHGEKNPSAKKKHGEGEDKSTKRHVHVEPGVQVDLVKELKDKYERSENESTTYNNKQLLLTKVSAALLLIYATFTGLQLWNSHRNFLVDQRAWIYIGGMNLRPLQISEPAKVDVWINNAGRTPGSPTGGAILLNISHEPIEHVEDITNTPKPVAGIVFPGIVYVPEITVSKNVAMAADIEAFNAKPPRLWIYVYGRMEYRDIFGDHHTTSYCAVSNGTTNFGGCPQGTYPVYAN